AMPTPPYRVTWRRGVCCPKASMTVWICSASSRVGARINARTCPVGPCRSRCKIGSTNAAVLPVPVCASPNTSQPCSTGGMACCWMGVGIVYPSAWTPAIIRGCKGNAVKLTNNPPPQRQEAYGPAVRTPHSVSTLWDRPTATGRRCHTPAPQGLQQTIVAHHRCPDRRVAHVGNGKFLTRLSDQGADGRVMDVA